MFCPKMIGSAMPIVTLPEAARVCKIPTLAAEEAITAVMTAPIKTPKRGFSKIVIAAANSGDWASGAIAWDITPSPMKSMPMPISAPPKVLCFCFLL